HPTAYEGPSTKILSADIHNSIIADGTTIHGARIVNSVIRSGVTIQEGVTVEDSIVMDHT
ncbi:MAG TPA: glucose-1-phosphate adenylyltransferase, partial [Nitrospiraceae bacterium]|nr:glucose-1-phosphate adenylyltransferase [Nitrospiraceae bacterium]